MRRPSDIHVPAMVLAAVAVLLLGAWALPRAAGYTAEPGGWIDGRQANAFERHYNEQFPLQNLSRNLWTAARYRLFGEGLDGLVIGQGGWFYTEQEFQPYPDAGARVERHLAEVIAVRDELARRGIRLQVALLPAKARIYADRTGEHEPADPHALLYPRFRMDLRFAGIDAPDLDAALRACRARGPVFLRTDTHWTPLGARCAAHALAALPPPPAHLNASGQRFQTAPGPARAHRGDLLNYLPLAPLFSHWLPRPEPVRTVQLVDRRPPDTGLLGDAPPVPVALVGTSYSADPRWGFASFLKTVFDTDVENFATEGEGPFLPMRAMLELIGHRARGPRLVIWEIPERYLLQEHRPRHRVTAHISQQSTEARHDT